MKTLIRRVLGRTDPEFPWHNREPVREELFSVERLEEHARSLAVAQRVAPTLGAGPSTGKAPCRQCGCLAGRLSQDRQGNRPGPDDYAGRGMADRQLSSRRKAGSRNSRAISRPDTTANCRNSRDGPFAGYPRVFGMAWAFVAHADSRFDVEMLCRYVQRLSGRPAAHDRRALGDLDHAADRADRESSTVGRADRRQLLRAAGSGSTRRPPAGCGIARAGTRVGRSVGPREDAASRRVRGRADPPAARSGSESDAGSDVAR